MLIHDAPFVIADIRRAKAELEAALLACDQLLARDPEVAVAALPVTGETVIEHSRRAWKFALSARSKRKIMRQQVKQGEIA